MRPSRRLTMPVRKYEEVSEFIICQCGSLEHMAHFGLTWWTDNKKLEGCEFYVQIHLAPTTFFERLKNAFTYLFGINNKSGSFDEILITRERADKLVEMINKFIELDNKMQNTSKVIY